MSSSKRGVRAKSIGHYILGRTIGEGTFGKVKLGTHLRTGEKVAVKILEKERIVDVADVERVSREIHILKLIRNPHIIQLYEIIETPRQLYLIMEYASGGELFDYIVAHSRVKEREACRFFHQILAGVEKVHQMRVVHRDLKPENLLLDDQKHIKIVDFGLSNTYQDGQLLKTACGSPCYASPEMIAGKRYVPSCCDVWSCGVILFALICGYLPFEDQNTAMLYKKILNGDFTLPNFISPESGKLIRGMLTVDPTKRLTIPQIRQTAWYNMLSEADCCAPEKMIIGVNGVQPDEEVLAQMEQFDISREYAIKCLEKNKHNHVTTTYYLLVDKKMRLLNRLKQMEAQSVEQNSSAATALQMQPKPPDAGTYGHASKTRPRPVVPKLALDSVSDRPVVGETPRERERPHTERSHIPESRGRTAPPMVPLLALDSVRSDAMDTPRERPQTERLFVSSHHAHERAASATPTPPPSVPVHSAVANPRARRIVESLVTARTHAAAKVTGQVPMPAPSSARAKPTPRSTLPAGFATPRTVPPDRLFAKTPASPRPRETYTPRTTTNISSRPTTSSSRGGQLTPREPLVPRPPSRTARPPSRAAAVTPTVRSARPRI